MCPKCKEAGQIFEEAAMGNVFICTHGGGRSVSSNMSSLLKDSTTSPVAIIMQVIGVRV